MSALPGEEKGNESDPSVAKWLLTCLPQTLGLFIIQLQMKAGAPRMSPFTLPEPSWTSPPDCVRKWNALFSAARHIYQLFKKQSMRQSNIFPVQAGPSSAGTLIGSAAPVWTGSTGGPLEPGGNVLGPNMADLGGAARGRKWEMLPSWAVMRWNVLGGGRVARLVPCVLVCPQAGESLVLLTLVSVLLVLKAGLMLPPCQKLLAFLPLF